MAELDTAWLTTVLAADSELDVLAGAAAFGCGDLHQLANAGLVDHGERIVGDDFLLLIVREERAGVVAALPSAVCVRSFVPKLKNWAVSAISSAVRAPRGTSIIVPTR